MFASTMARNVLIAKFKRLANLSIFGRTFLLMLAALIVAEGIGLVLILTRPPIHNRLLSIYELAQRLDERESAPRENPSFGPPGPPPGNDRFAPDFAMGPPPDAMSGSNSLPLFRAGGFSQSNPNTTAELNERIDDSAPAAPDNFNRIASDNVRKRLAKLLRIDENALRVYLPKNRNAVGSLPPNDTNLSEGFIAARQLSDGSWRIVESTAQSFPNPFQRHAMLLFSIGLIFLLPIAWIFSRALSIPIANFSKAAKRIGTDPNSSPLPVEGPKEMLAAIESFNAMQERLNGLLRERTEMIAAIAHDLRTPLTRLAFRLDDLPSPLSEKVNADIEEMKSMISLALDFIRDRSQGINRERLDFRLLVESVVDDQTDLGYDVTFAGGTSVTLEGDPLALRRAIMNIVDNAIKYGERARLQLTVTAEQCVLDIDDDGPGINEALHKRVFDPFFRVESSRNRDTGGVGLGLAVVRAIIHEHGGEILLRNRSPRGLRVTIKLPLAIH